MLGEYRPSVFFWTELAAVSQYNQDHGLLYSQCIALLFGKKDTCTV